MNSKKGFTLAEMVAVIAILMILTLISAPFVRGYIDDSYFYKAKSFLRQVNEARMNFEKDFPGTRVSGVFPMTKENVANCDIDNIHSTAVVDPQWLINCNYIKPATDLRERYEFNINNASTCGTGTVMVSAIGLEEAGSYSGACVSIDKSGVESEDIPS